ncbi:hypothetical protein [Flavihumibacter sp. UBA7668]|uniref:hypothetical protein n=1 Tax=Flavihumibacter sp. UBA7668 TaxID=1946542 RepID=UPI0025BDF915|nr:hypothetical protein [Flavihumibacter sp. UBA7668]
MLNFEQQYLTEIGNVFNQTALLPGCAVVQPGQVIRFPQITRSTWKPEPLPFGAFQIMPAVQAVPDLVTEEADTPNFRFANATLYWESLSENRMAIRMPVPGTVLLLAIECSIFRLNNSLERLKELKHLKNEHWWKEGFLVTSLTVAKRALIVQSASADCYFEIEGKVEELIKRGGARLTEWADLRIHNTRETALEISWQENLPIVMETLPLYQSTISKLLSIPGLRPSPLLVMNLFNWIGSLITGAPVEMKSTK